MPFQMHKSETTKAENASLGKARDNEGLEGFLFKVSMMIQGAVTCSIYLIRMTVRLAGVALVCRSPGHFFQGLPFYVWLLVSHLSALE